VGCALLLPIIVRTSVVGPIDKHDRQAGKLIALFEMAKWVRFGHVQTLQTRPPRLKLIL